MNKNNIYLLQNKSNNIYIFFKVSIMHIFIYTNNILHLLQNNTDKRFLVFKDKA